MRQGRFTGRYPVDCSSSLERLSFGVLRMFVCDERQNGAVPNTGCHREPVAAPTSYMRLRFAHGRQEQRAWSPRSGSRSSVPVAGRGMLTLGIRRPEFVRARRPSHKPHQAGGSAFMPGERWAHGIVGTLRPGQPRRTRSCGVVGATRCAVGNRDRSSSGRRVAEPVKVRHLPGVT